MKYHYIYFGALLILLFVALTLPFTIYDYFGTREYINAFDRTPLAYIYLFPAVIATILLLIPNRFTALIGAVFYLGTFVFAALVYYVLSEVPFREESGAGPFAAALVTLTGLTLSIIHSVKLFKAPRNHKSESPELLDDLI